MSSGYFEVLGVNEKVRDKVLNCKVRIQKDTRQNSLVLLSNYKAEQVTEKARKSPSTKSWEM